MMLDAKVKHNLLAIDAASLGLVPGLTGASGLPVLPWPVTWDTAETRSCRIVHGWWRKRNTAAPHIAAHSLHAPAFFGKALCTRPVDGAPTANLGLPGRNATCITCSTVRWPATPASLTDWLLAGMPLGNAAAVPLSKSLAAAAAAGHVHEGGIVVPTPPLAASTPADLSDGSSPSASHSSQDGGAATAQQGSTGTATAPCVAFNPLQAGIAPPLSAMLTTPSLGAIAAAAQASCANGGAAPNLWVQAAVAAAAQAAAAMAHEQPGSLPQFARRSAPPGLGLPAPASQSTMEDSDGSGTPPPLQPDISGPAQGPASRPLSQSVGGLGPSPGGPASRPPLHPGNRSPLPPLGSLADHPAAGICSGSYRSSGSHLGGPPGGTPLGASPPSLGTSPAAR